MFKSFGVFSVPIEFLTGSMYDGKWDRPRKRMDGLGCYTFADGSTYRGYFKDGRFHGFGILHLATPYSFEFHGFFISGQLIEVFDMIFWDGLQINIENNSGFNEWNYCTKEDRRFVKEIEWGLQAVGPSAMVTHCFIERELKPGQYDFEEGIFISSNGCIFNRRKPLKPTGFITCMKTIAWIKKYCRAGRQPNQVIEPSEDFCREIIENNLNSRQLCYDNFDDEGYCSKYFLKLYKMKQEDAKNILKGRKKMFTNKVPICEESSNSCRSFSDEAFLKNRNLLMTDKHEFIMAKFSCGKSIR